MRRDQVEHAVRAACQIIRHPAVILVGSQSILGTCTEDQLSEAATMSIEIDVLPHRRQQRGDRTTGRPDRGRCRRVVALRTAARFQHRRCRPQHRAPRGRLARPPREGPERQHRRAHGRAAFHRLVPGREDLCVAKLCAFREKDRNFVAALLDAQLVDGDVITTQLRALPTTHRAATERALAWLASRRRHEGFRPARYRAHHRA